MRWIERFVVVAWAGFAAACGGVSENPLADGKNGGRDGTGAMGGTASGSGGTSSGGSGTGGSDDCDSGLRNNLGKCLLDNGKDCDSDADCVNYCADGVCCDEPCNGVCESCNVPNRGTCALLDPDPECPHPYQCMGKNVCLIPDGGLCDDANPEACASKYCAPTNAGTTVCCDEECRGTCQTCGSDGKCTDFPLSDDRCGPETCPTHTRCVTYLPPALHTCSGNGECASCGATNTHAGAACDAGKVCDGAGACTVNGRGRVAAGEHHTCAINKNNNVVCWGDNRFGQLGAVFTRARVGFDEFPHQVADREIDFEKDVVQLTAGAQHTCVLFDTGGVRCWGTMWNNPTFGTVATIIGTVDVTFVLGSELLAPPWGFIDPLQTGNVILPEPAEQISAGPESATICALLESGKISCWGMNAKGQLGLGHREQLLLAHLEVLPDVDLGERAVEVRSGFAHTCALTLSGKVQCWGEGLYGRLGSGNQEPRYLPDFVDIGTTPAVGLAVGLDHSCVLLEGGAVRCWGNNHQGQLGYGHTDAIGDNETPRQAAMSSRPMGVALGGDVALAGAVSQIVTFSASSVQRAVDLDGDGDPNGENDGFVWDSSPTCALGKDGFVRCWGRNDVGQLGYGHDLPGATENTPLRLGVIRSSDRFVETAGNVLALAENGRCALLATEEDKTPPLNCWGLNDQGQVGGQPLGDPHPSVTLKPFQIGPIHWWADP